MKKTTKVLLTLACAVLLVAASVMGTLAYLTDHDSVNNTFTVGKVDINLDEKDVTKTDGSRTETGNSYHLLPGHTYDKDPTVTVLKGSDSSYIRMLVTVTFDQKLADATLATKLDSIFVGYDANNWPRESKNVSTATVGEGDNKKEVTVITYEYRYKETVSAKDSDVALDALFDQVKIPDTWDNNDMKAVGNFKIEVVAQAIQASGFVAADGKTAEQVAWTAFDTQYASQSTT